jgi:hypothetical protein
VREHGREISSLRNASRESTQHMRHEEQQWTAAETSGRRLILKEEKALKKDLFLQTIGSFKDIGVSVLKDVQMQNLNSKSSSMKKSDAKLISKELKQLAVDLVGNKSAAPIGKEKRILCRENLTIGPFSILLF